MHSPTLSTFPQRQLSFCEHPALHESPSALHSGGCSIASASVSDEPHLTAVGAQPNDWSHRSQPHFPTIRPLPVSSLLSQFGFADVGNPQVFKSKYFCEHSVTEAEELINYSKLNGQLGLDIQSSPTNFVNWTSPTVQVSETNSALIQEEVEALHLETLPGTSHAQDSLLAHLLSADVFSTESGDDSPGEERGLERNIFSGRQDSRKQSNQKRKAQECEMSSPQKQKKLKKLPQPIYALQIRSEADVVDDGYKWRKYGQKSVKTSSHPRSYYRCTISTCPVKKRVERSAEDSGMVVNTYHGIHNHYNCGSLQLYFDQTTGTFPQLHQLRDQLLSSGETSSHLGQVRQEALCDSIVQLQLVHNLALETGCR